MAFALRPAPKSWPKELQTIWNDERVSDLEDLLLSFVVEDEKQKAVKRFLFGTAEITVGIVERRKHRFNAYLKWLDYSNGLLIKEIRETGTIEDLSFFDDPRKKK